MRFKTCVQDVRPYRRSELRAAAKAEASKTKHNKDVEHEDGDEQAAPPKKPRKRVNAASQREDEKQQVENTTSQSLKQEKKKRKAGTKEDEEDQKQLPKGKGEVAEPSRGKKRNSVQSGVAAPGEEKPKAKAKAKAKVEAKKDDGRKKTKDSPPACFARRRCPTTERSKLKWFTLRGIFETDIKPHVTKFSTHEETPLAVCHLYLSSDTSGSFNCSPAFLKITDMWLGVVILERFNFLGGYTIYHSAKFCRTPK